MQSLQQNNTFLTQPIRSRCRNTLWTVALVHGHFKQVKLSIFGRELNVVLISRRSRHFAGTRRLADLVLSLILLIFEKRPREMMLRREYFNAVGYLNQNVPEEKKLRFIHWDFHKFAKSKSANVRGVLGGGASEALDLTGFYYIGYLNQNVPEEKKLRFIHWDFHKFAKRDGSIDIRASSGDLPRL
uniref:SAC domain-containing protein n=1 Tax=Oryza rufipogon TaxID=4529 RepID=A0A0E0PXN5_ORYRU